MDYCKKAEVRGKRYPKLNVFEITVIMPGYKHIKERFDMSEKFWAVEASGWLAGTLGFYDPDE